MSLHKSKTFWRITETIAAGDGGSFTVLQGLASRENHKFSLRLVLVRDLRHLSGREPRALTFEH